jgi:hypothetical protein
MDRNLSRVVLNSLLVLSPLTNFFSISSFFHLFSLRTAPGVILGSGWACIATLFGVFCILGNNSLWEARNRLKDKVFWDALRSLPTFKRAFYHFYIQMRKQILDTVVHGFGGLLVVAENKTS